MSCSIKGSAGQLVQTKSVRGIHASGRVQYKTPLHDGQSLANACFNPEWLSTMRNNNPFPRHRNEETLTQLLPPVNFSNPRCEKENFPTQCLDKRPHIGVPPCPRGSRRLQ